MAEPKPWAQATQYLMRPPNPDMVDLDAQQAETQATAQFLLTRGPFAWIGFFDWQVRSSRQTPTSPGP